MKIKDYAFPQTPEEAYTLLQKKNAVILGGCAWLRMQKRTVSLAVDLSRIGLDKIEETEDGIRIGAYVTLRDLETSPLLSRYTQGTLTKALSPIVGVQFRNTVTVGGSVFGRFGFSDVLTVLLALGASVELYRGGIVPLSRFAEEGAAGDLLLSVLLPKEAPDAVSVQAQRNTKTDFPVLTVCACRREKTVVTAVGARPLRAKAFCTNGIPSVDDMTARYDFSSNTRGSEEYRRHLCRVLLSRAYSEIGEG